MIRRQLKRGALRHLLMLAMVLSGSAGAALSKASEEPVTIAVAANALAPMKVITGSYASATGHQLRLVPGATGALYAQVLLGAPFDVFVSADVATVGQLEQKGRLVPDSRITYARGQLVLWSRNPARVDARATVLQRGEGLRLALAHPARAPYGAAAMAVLEALQVEEAWRDRLVFGESVGKTWQFIASGNADLGFVAASQLHGQAGGSHWRVPAALHPPLDQQAGLLRRGEDNPAAAAFLDHLCTPAAQATFQDFGYLPGGCDAPD